MCVRRGGTVGPALKLGRVIALATAATCSAKEEARLSESHSMQSVHGRCCWGSPAAPARSSRGLRGVLRAAHCRPTAWTLRASAAATCSSARCEAARAAPPLQQRKAEELVGCRQVPASTCVCRPPAQPCRQRQLPVHQSLHSSPCLLAPMRHAVPPLDTYIPLYTRV